MNITELLRTKENIHLEAKTAERGLPRSMWETYSSFANTDGGVILLGVEENPSDGSFSVRGITDTEKMLKDIWNGLNNPKTVSVNLMTEERVRIETLDGKNIIVMEVPRADRRERPVFLGDNMRNSYRRNHEGDYRMTRQEVNQALREQDDSSSIDRLVLEESDLSILSSDTVRAYRARFDGERPNSPWRTLSDEEFLIRIHAAARSKGKIRPTVAGLLVFGTNTDIISEFPAYFLDYRENDGTAERWSDRIYSADPDRSGNLYDFWREVSKRIAGDVKTPFRVDDEMYRIDDTPVHKAVREILANTLIHADYTGRRGVVVTKTFRKLEFSNPGAFLIDVDEAVSGGISEARNPMIAFIFTLVNIGERAGTGLSEVFSVWEKNGFTMPKITQLIEPQRTTVSLTLDYPSAPSSFRYDDEMPEMAGYNVIYREAPPFYGMPQLKEKESMFLSFVRKNREASILEISEALGVSASTARRIEEKLEGKGILIRSGNRKSPIWRII